MGFPSSLGLGKNHLLLGRGKFPREEAAAQRRRDGGGGARRDPEATATAMATTRLSPPAATFSPVSTLPFPFFPPLAKLGFLVSERLAIRRPPPRILLDLVSS
uniref:Uncharacterized protein n=1 Tax=Oryza sativa subsp. japonica TaxID=39947 RepID=Q69UD9_ORYSJ|nr:hypothetical protein [Oryza sativa Japonica Group]